MGEAPGFIPSDENREGSTPEKNIHLESTSAAWRDSEAMRMVESRAIEGMGKYALITDIDNTFYRPWDGAEQNYSREIAEISDISQCPIIYVTGNAIDSVLERIADGQLPPAQVIVGATGTDIAVLCGGQHGQLRYQRDESFTREIAQLPFPREDLVRKAGELIEATTEQDASVPDVGQRKATFQHPEKESQFLSGQAPPEQPYKISLYFFANSNGERRQYEAYVQSNFPEQLVLTCEEIGHNNTLEPGDTYKKYCLDIVPIAKAGAADYVIRRLGLEGGILSGDSGNDDHVYRNLNPDFVRILVGGAREEGRVNIDSRSIDRRSGEPLAGKNLNDIGFRRLVLPDDTTALAFKEPGQNTGEDKRIGPQSILYALEALQRWETQSRLKNHSNDESLSAPDN